MFAYHVPWSRPRSADAARGHSFLDKPLIHILERVAAIGVHRHNHSLLPLTEPLEVGKHTLTR